MSVSCRCHLSRLQGRILRAWMWSSSSSPRKHQLTATSASPSVRWSGRKWSRRECVRDPCRTEAAGARAMAPRVATQSGRAGLRHHILIVAATMPAMSACVMLWLQEKVVGIGFECLHMQPSGGAGMRSSLRFHATEGYERCAKISKVIDRRGLVRRGHDGRNDLRLGAAVRRGLLAALSSPKRPAAEPAGLTGGAEQGERSGGGGVAGGHPCGPRRQRGPGETQCCGVPSQGLGGQRIWRLGRRCGPQWPAADRPIMLSKCSGPYIYTHNHRFSQICRTFIYLHRLAVAS